MALDPAAALPAARAAGSGGAGRDVYLPRHRVSRRRGSLTTYWASCPDGDIAPWHGIRRGKAEVPGFFKELGGALEITEFTPLSFASNETDVMVVTRWAATAPATGKSVAMDIHHWWRFRDGKICFYRGTEDTAATQALLRRD